MPLVLSGVTHRYGAAPAVLAGVDLEVASGTAVAIVGPSGSGKTTLLSIIGGLLTPTEGRVSIDGQSVTHLLPGTIAWVFQGINLLGHRTVTDNVGVGLGAVSADREAAAKSISDALDAVGLRPFAAVRALHLSGGQAQRVGIARAIVGQPRYLIADEPTGQLDHATSAAIGEILLRKRSPGTVLIVATHDPDLAQFCDRRLLLADGKLRST